MITSSIERARPFIFQTLDALGQSVFTKSEILGLLRDFREDWGLAKSTTGTELIEMLIQNNRLFEVELDFRSGKIVRYELDDAREFELFQSIKTDGYFSHFTALFLHDLTEQIPKTIYLNSEQSPKSRSKGGLTQGGIDAAFNRRARKTTNIARYRDKNIYLINGKHTSNLGVIQIKSPDGTIVNTTDIERSLVDAVVRPEYSGGVYVIAEAYKRAADQVSANRLRSHLKKLDHLYPFHQVIGFYMERAGNYSENAIDLFRELGMNYDFYLTNQMNEVEYSETWRLYFPKGF